MQKTTDRPPVKQGLFRRFLLRGESVRAAHQPGPMETHLDPPAVIDLRDDVPAAQWRVAVAERIERLEEGMALVAGTMKRAFSQVYGSIEDLRAGHSGAPDQLERILEESVASLKTAVDDLSESIHRVPYVLAAAADDITAKLETATTETAPEAGPIPTSPTALPDRDHGMTPELLPATPFELEPIEEQFDPMDEEGDEPDAKMVLRMEA